MEKKAKKKGGAGKRPDWNCLRCPRNPPESEADILPFRLQQGELDTDMKHPYVKELYKNYRRLRKKLEKIITTKTKLQDKGGDRSILNKDQLEQLNGEAAVYAEFCEVIDRNEAYQESIRLANVVVRVEEPGQEKKEPEEHEEEKKEVPAPQGPSEEAIRQQERSATEKSMAELVADIFLAQSAVQTVMTTEVLARTESDFYAFNQLISFNYIRSPLQFQAFGGSPSSMQEKFCALLLRLYHESEEPVNMNMVAASYTYKDLRDYVRKLSAFAKDKLMDYAKHQIDRQQHQFPVAAYPHPEQKPEIVDDISQKQQEAQVEDRTRGLVEDEHSPPQEKPEHHEDEEHHHHQEEGEEHHAKEEHANKGTWADAEDSDEEDHTTPPAHEEKEVQEMLHGHHHGEQEAEHYYNDQAGGQGYPRPGKYYTKHPRGKEGHSEQYRPRGGYGRAKGRAQHGQGYHGNEEEQYGYHHHYEKKGGRGHKAQPAKEFKDSDEEYEEGPHGVDADGYKIVQDPSEKKKHADPYHYRQYGAKPRGGYRSGRSGYHRGDRGGYGEHRGERGGYGQHRGGWRGNYGEGEERGGYGGRKSFGRGYRRGDGEYGHRYQQRGAYKQGGQEEGEPQIG